jgi:hypothetical protein
MKLIILECAEERNAEGEECAGMSGNERGTHEQMEQTERNVH